MSSRGLRMGMMCFANSSMDAATLVLADHWKHGYSRSALITYIRKQAFCIMPSTAVNHINYYCSCELVARSGRPAAELGSFGRLMHSSRENDLQSIPFLVKSGRITLPSQTAFCYRSMYLNPFDLIKFRSTAFPCFVVGCERNDPPNSSCSYSKNESTSIVLDRLDH